MKTSTSNNIERKNGASQVKDDYKVGDMVRHTPTGKVAKIEAICERDFGNEGRRKLYTVNFDKDTIGPGGVRYLGAKYLAEALAPATLKPTEDITDFADTLADDIKVGDYVTINSDGRPAVVVRIGCVCGNYGSMLYLDDWTNWAQDCRKINGWNVVCTTDEVTPITADMLQPTTDGTKDDYNVGDRVRHNHSGREATITAVRVSATVKTFGNLRKVYRLDFGETVLGPFGYDLNGAEFVAEALTPLLPEPPKEVTISDEQSGKAEREDSGEITAEPTLYERHNITADERHKRAEGSAQYIRRQARLAREAFYHHKGARIETSIAYRNDTDDPDKMSYKVCWYDETRTGRLHLVDCENGISLGQAARHMADFALLTECGLTLREILYPAA